MAREKAREKGNKQKGSGEGLGMGKEGSGKDEGREVSAPEHQDQKLGLALARQVGSGGAAGARGLGGSTSGAIEREVQRRVTEVLSAAGVAQGRLTHEVLFMLPHDFVKAYVKLFDQALTESVSGSGSGGSDVDARATAKVTKRPASRQPNSRGAAGGGKRYRTHWVIRDEEAFRLKGSVDRKLARLAGKIARDLSKKADTLGGEVICERCNHNLTDIIEEFGKGRIMRCVRCGEGIREGLEE